MSFKRLHVAALTAILLAGVPSLASAQIYSWRDEGGNLVLSNRPKAGAVRTFAVANSAPSIRSTRRVVNNRAAEFEPLIQEHAHANGVSPDLVRAVIQAESAFNPRARSHKGAMGLMQLMPATAAEYNVRDPYNPVENVRAGVKYLKSLLVRYTNKVELALAAYNAGPTAVNKYGTIPPFRETRDYVAKIKATGSVRTPTKVYTSTEVVDGRPVTRLSNKPSNNATAVKTGIN